LFYEDNTFSDERYLVSVLSDAGRSGRVSILPSSSVMPFREVILVPCNTCGSQGGKNYIVPLRLQQGSSSSGAAYVDNAPASGALAGRAPELPDGPAARGEPSVTPNVATSLQEQDKRGVVTGQQQSADLDPKKGAGGNQSGKRQRNSDESVSADKTSKAPTAKARRKTAVVAEAALATWLEPSQAEERGTWLCALFGICAEGSTKTPGQN
jgi:hypothetical protein